MKRIIISTFLALTSQMSIGQSNEGTEGIKFETNAWVDILAKAKKENKYVFVDAYTTWCGPCKRMDKNIFPQAEVGTFFNKNFVNVKIDMEKGEGLEIAKKYNVNSFPTFLYVDGNGELVHRLVGFMEAPAFIEASSNALNPEKQYVTQLKKFENGEKNPDFIYKLAYIVKGAYDLPKAKELAAAYLKTQQNLMDKKNVIFISDFTLSPSDPNYEFMRKNASTFEAAMGKEVYTEKMYGIAYQGLYSNVEFRYDGTKEQVTASIKSAEEYFNKVLPEQAPKLSNAFAVYAYLVTKNWDEYATQVVAFFDKYPNHNSIELSSVAGRFFENVDRVEYLQKAVTWALESVRLQEGYTNLDTVAKLYFKLGDKIKAKEYANKAIVLGKANGEDTSSTEKLLQNIL